MLVADIVHKTVLLAPLDWGLGHTTRCIPILRQLLAQDCKVIFAGNKLQRSLIARDFPEILLEDLAGYDVKLDSGKSTYTQLIGQFRAMKKMVKKEHELAGLLAQKHQVDVIISDNRYGFYTNGVTNIFITHQFSPPIPFFRKRIASMIRRFIDCFDFCWVPDNKENPLCKDMLKGSIDIPVVYIGLLSRFEARKFEIDIDVLLIVSGPEPERSRFQERMTQLLDRCYLNYRIASPNASDRQEVVFHPSTEELEELINRCKLVISRAGYTSIMEMSHLRKKSIMIPTQGQYEQEYLAGNVDSPYISFFSEDEFTAELLIDFLG